MTGATFNQLAPRFWQTDPFAHLRIEDAEELEDERTRLTAWLRCSASQDMMTRAQACRRGAA